MAKKRHSPMIPWAVSIKRKPVIYAPSQNTIFSIRSLKRKKCQLTSESGLFTHEYANDSLYNRRQEVRSRRFSSKLVFLTRLRLSCFSLEDSIRIYG